ncbi:cytochrome P450 [Ornithinibacillus scapharcae]|uniref:cytochrome P450 n=1 Tax=Ornithinibacillus scapharcae TaxID=1147159 RepID=UPI000225C0EB|nr:cytochrome P450 [Ornithinibacillus scapharcae]
MPYREQIPIEKGLDNTAKLMLEGYNYITNRRKKFGRDLFETRILGGQKAICIAGEEAVKVFYDEDKIQRKGAAPKRIRQTLFGEHAIQTLDDQAHRHRKELFMSFMTKEKLDEVSVILERQLDVALDKWVVQERIVFYREIVQLLTKVAFEWTGVPIRQDEIKKRANQLEALFDSAGAVGVRHWKGRTSRNILENWLKQIITQVRNGDLTVSQDTILYQMAWYQDKNGELLNEQIVAVEVLNILRPIVAISIYLTFEALAIYEHPSEREKLKKGGEKYQELFVQEVRRYYPFFPMLIARVREDFLWNGHDFRKGNFVILDIYGTNHHPDIWEMPNVFNPERFRNRKENFYEFIPQGGGDYYRGHRCPGEWLTIEFMKILANFIVNKVEYSIPRQEHRYSMIRIPSLPKSGLIMTHVKRV